MRLSPLFDRKNYQSPAKPIPQKKLTAKKLAEAIREVTTNQVIRQNAATLGEKIGEEEGITNAIAIIESVAQPS